MELITAQLIGSKLYTQALWIKIMRVDAGCSWARIGEIFEMRNNAFEYEFVRRVNGACVGDIGRQLCELAASAMNEDVAKWDDLL